MTADRTAATPAMELLVHGVGGASPEQLLADQRTTRITGDGTASIHRRTADLDDRPWDDTDPLREAYTWSGLTSGNAARALWLLLLPFMVVNLVHWMRPGSPRPRAAHYAYDVLLRLLALTLTVLLAAGACAVCLDLVAWQCGGAPECAANVSWLGPLTSEGGWWQQPGRRLALAAAVPAALTGLLWWLSHRTWSAYESASPPVRPRPDAEGSALLSQPGFWYGRQAVSKLRATHTAAALLTVCAALLAVTARRDAGADGSAPLAAAGWALAALTAAGMAAVTALQLRHHRTEDEPDVQPVPRAVAALPWAALGLLLLTAVYTAWDRPGWQASGRLTADGVLTALIAVQGALVLGLALAAAALHRRAPRGARGVLAGLGGAAVALLACALGGALTGGVTQYTSDLLDPAAGEPDGLIPGPPVLLSWQAAAVPALLCGLVVAAAAAAWRAWRRRQRLREQVRGWYPGESCEAEPARSRSIATAVALAELTDLLPQFVGGITVLGVALGAAAVAGSLTGEPPVQALRDAPDPLPALTSASHSLGSWLLAGAVVLLVALGRRAYRDAGARRTIGILWDVGTFWPRAAHPFAPPCYAERAVPDLSWRMGTWIDATGGRLVISGHSQGSVLAAAAVWQLDAATRSRTALLTHGSPLQRLYGRWFPAFFGPDALRSLHGDVPCWRNLWRATDPIGGPVGVAAAGLPPVDRGPLDDPLYYGRNLLRPLPEPVLGHGDYAEDPAFAEERAALHRRLSRQAGDGALPRPAGPAAAEQEAAG
ncbi:hypothetical protein [Streptomyces sp. 7-21]|uniref:hypothetical protein n=1 Tax=Streptomyces sp. 7-21 TaxID=2802283 RepID=UPI00191DACE8|nr:hypothetical protein [Streptomyces sp. 7-21]MBL1067227.1 hypothetical protein [Streptomyces sp. 7-21]